MSVPSRLRDTMTNPLMYLNGWSHRVFTFRSDSRKTSESRTHVDENHHRTAPPTAAPTGVTSGPQNAGSSAVASAGPSPGPREETGDTGLGLQTSA